MKEPMFLDFLHPQDLPSVSEIAEKARSIPYLVLRSPTTFEILAPGYPVARDAPSEFNEFKMRLVEKLTLLLPDHRVVNAAGRFDKTLHNNPERRPVGAIVPGTSWLILMRVISEDKVLTHANAIIEAAQSFREIASILANRLAAKLNIPVEAFANPLFRGYGPPGHTLPSGHYPICVLDAEWTYRFNGLECQFININTGQCVRIRFGYLNEFGVLDAHFFVKFLQTTPQFQPVAQLFEDEYYDTQRALEVLERHGRLKRVQGTPLELADGTSLQKSGLVALPE